MDGNRWIAVAWEGNGQRCPIDIHASLQQDYTYHVLDSTMYIKTFLSYL